MEFIKKHKTIVIILLIVFACNLFGAIVYISNQAEEQQNNKYSEEIKNTTDNAIKTSIELLIEKMNNSLGE